MSHQGQCRLCLTQAELLDSHIVPRWAWKRARAEGSANPHPAMLGGGLAIQHPKQESEHLLCANCERLMKTGDDLAAEVTYQKDYEKAPLLDRVGLVVAGHDRLRIVPPGTLDVRLLAYFAVSVVWRASVSTVIPECKLSDTIEEETRLYLLHRGAPPPDLRCVLTFHDIPYGERSHLASMFGLPFADNDGFTFPLYGLECHVTSAVASRGALKPFCALHGAEGFILLAPQDDLLDKYGEWFMRQKARGALARRPR